jgi:hypothetical protein
MHFYLMLYYLLVYIIVYVLLLVVLMFVYRPLQLLYINFNARYLV